MTNVTFEPEQQFAATQDYATDIITVEFTREGLSNLMEYVNEHPMLTDDGMRLTLDWREYEPGKAQLSFMLYKENTP